MTSSISLPLLGCAPTPLAHYLKALGILRLVSEQTDSAATVCWSGNTFTLSSTLNRESLLSFFLEQYQPTPIIAPWNGGSGFFPKDNKSGIEPIRKASGTRFVRFQEAIQIATECLTTLGLQEKPDGKDVKEALLALCRNRASDSALEWLDSAFVLTDDGAKYPPLLGTGGNDGRLDFTNNFMQRLTELFDLPEGKPTPSSRAWLENSLFDTTLPVLVNGSIGQFSPAATGGFNSSTGFDSNAAINPWNYVLMMEGAILFAGAAVKRLESASMGQLVYPFSVKQAGVGYGSAALSDEADSRCEMWVPLWEQSVGLPELKALLSEGRSQVNGHAAKNGVDFARAVATLGVDRGISSFQRYGFQVRNGLAYFATPLDRVFVKRNQLASQLLAPIDGWLEKFRRAARADGAPASAQRSARRLEAAIISFCKSSDRERVQELLISLGDCEATMARSWKWAKEKAFLPPIPLLSPKWLKASDTGTVEFRLAASLASLSGVFGKLALPFRCHLEPVASAGGREKRWFSWTETIETNVVWHGGSLVDVMNDILTRRIILANKTGCKSYPDFAKITASPSDIAQFIENQTDDRLIALLFWGLMLVDFGGEYTEEFHIQSSTFSPHRIPPALYSLLKPCFSKHKLRGNEIPLIPAIYQKLRSGNGNEASILAVRRLRGSGLVPAIDNLSTSPVLTKRIAAALLFPLSENNLGKIAETLLRPSEINNQTHQ